LEPQIKILVVEDNPGDVFIVNELLRSSGINFVSSNASTLKDTLKLCGQNDYDIVLLDLGLPDSMGLETLKEIYSSRVKSPLVVMTGLDDENTALEALREGAQDYLVKNSLTADGILRSIKYSIERKKIQDLHRIYAHRFSILSAATAALNECENVPSMFKIICANLSLLLNDAGALAIEFPEQDKIRISGTEWLKPWFDDIESITGWDLNDPIFPVIEKTKHILNSFENNRLHKIEGGIYEVVSGTISSENSIEIEKLLGINHIYAIGFLQHRIFYGGFLIFTQNLIGNDDTHVIETISNQTALNIHRRTIERDLRISEDRYKKLNKDLEQNVWKRTSDLEMVNSRLQKELADRIQAEEALKESETLLIELNATKDKFFNIVAHDLKNPFTSLLGASELLFQNIDQLDEENIRKLAIILNDSAKSGYAILQNLLDWSRSQTGLLKINPEHINLKSLVDENILNQELFSSNKEIEIHSEINEDIYIFADKNMINTVLRNLISNALKFSYRKGRIIIKALMNENEIVLSVKDFGIGIPGENMAKLFRIDSKFSLPGTENEQGTGLGLKLSREFVEKQGGKIWVKSRVGEGSEFMFSIPLKNNVL